MTGYQCLVDVALFIAKKGSFSKLLLSDLLFIGMHYEPRPINCRSGNIRQVLIFARRANSRISQFFYYNSATKKK